MMICAFRVWGIIHHVYGDQFDADYKKQRISNQSWRASGPSMKQKKPGCPGGQPGIVLRLAQQREQLEEKICGNACHKAADGVAEDGLAGEMAALQGIHHGYVGA